jgi:putative ABC transport system permease protein
VLTGDQVADEEADDIGEAFGFISQILLVFAGIALFVGSFIIYNTFSILVAQRTRELALLRALGASRRQLLGSVMLEAVVVGVVAAAAGIGVGMLLAAGALALLDAVGFDLPSAGLLLSSGTVIAALVAGLVVTLLSAVGPAVRATRVAPLAAMREAAVDRSGAPRGVAPSLRRGPGGQRRHRRAGARVRLHRRGAPGRSRCRARPHRPAGHRAGAGPAPGPGDRGVAAPGARA